MTVLELRDRLTQIMKANSMAKDDVVCIPNHKGGMGGTSATNIKGAVQGFDWNRGKLFILPETDMINKSNKP